MNGVYKYSTKAGDRWRIVYDGPRVADPETGEVKRRQTQRRGFTCEKDAKGLESYNVVILVGGACSSSRRGSRSVPGAGRPSAGR